MPEGPAGSAALATQSGLRADRHSGVGGLQSNNRRDYAVDHVVASFLRRALRGGFHLRPTAAFAQSGRWQNRPSRKAGRRDRQGRPEEDRRDRRGGARPRPAPPAIRNASGSAAGWSACSGATISTQPSAISTFTTVSAVPAPISRPLSAAWCARETSTPRRRIPSTAGCTPAGSIPALPPTAAVAAQPPRRRRGGTGALTELSH